MRLTALTGLALGVLSWPTAAATLAPSGTLNAGAQNWASHNSSDEDAYSALDGINRSNVKALGLEWSLDLAGEESLEATPLAVEPLPTTVPVGFWSNANEV